MRSGSYQLRPAHLLSIRIGEEAVLKTVALNGVQGSNPWGSAEGSSILPR